MNRHVASFLLASSLALGVSPAANAQPREGGRELHGQMQPMGGAHHRWLRRLDLTEAQRDQVFKIFHDAAPAMREQMKLARSSGQQLREAAAAPSFDRARARQLADTQARALGELAFMRADSMSRVVAILTPEQRTKLQQLRERGPRHGQRGAPTPRAATSWR